jgi:HEAT repeat protein
MPNVKKINSYLPPKGSVVPRTVADKAEFLKRVASTDLLAFRGMLNQLLADPSPTIRGQAVLLVAEHRLVEALPVIVGLLGDKSGEVRYDAAECVGVLQKDTGAAYPALRSLLLDESPLLRIQAAENLALIGDKGALPKIARLLSDRDPVVRLYAASAIAHLHGSMYAKHVERALRAEKQELAQVGLLEASFLFGRRDALAQLFGLLASHDYHVRCAAANTLEFLRLRHSERALVIDALRRAARKPLVFADASTVKRVLARLRPGKNRRRVEHP